MEIGLVVEGQDGLTWPIWRRFLGKVDQLGFSSLFRSDHFFVGEQRDAIEAYTSFVLAAVETSHLRFGPMVTPVMFRPPAEIGRMAAHIDGLSGGRFVLGLGIGWYADEHVAYGVAFPPVGERFDRLEEAITICRAMWADGPAYVDGAYYSLEGADCRPKPPRGTIPILVGGVGERRALRLVARHADEWCSECLSLEEYAHKVEVLEGHCAAIDRDPRSVRRSMIVFGDLVPSARRIVRGAIKHTLHATGVRRVPASTFDVAPRAGGFVVGGKAQIVDTLGEYAARGLQEAIFKVPDLHSDAFVEFLGTEVIGPARDL